MIKFTNSQLRHKFHCQRGSAKLRGIEWDLTYDKWLEIWVTSGHLNERGCGIGMYCMSRFGDQGPYSESNVFIQLWTKNTSDAHKGVPKISMRGKRHAPNQVTCPHCNKTGGDNIMHRFHFLNCKLSP